MPELKGMKRRTWTLIVSGHVGFCYPCMLTLSTLLGRPFPQDHIVRDPTHIATAAHVRATCDHLAINAMSMIFCAPPLEISVRRKRNCTTTVNIIQADRGTTATACPCRLCMTQAQHHVGSDPRGGRR